MKVHYRTEETSFFTRAFSDLTWWIIFLLLVTERGVHFLSITGKMLSCIISFEPKDIKNVTFIRYFRNRNFCRRDELHSVQADNYSLSLDHRWCIIFHLQTFFKRFLYAVWVKWLKDIAYFSATISELWPVWNYEDLFWSHQKTLPAHHETLPYHGG